MGPHIVVIVVRFFWAKYSENPTYAGYIVVISYTTIGYTHKHHNNI